VTLDAQDATSGVASTEYRLDGGSWTLYTGPFFVATFGPHTLDFRSTDVAGNAESTETVSWGSDFGAAAQIQGLSNFLAGLGLDKGTANDLRHELDDANKHLVNRKDACNHLNQFVVKVINLSGTKLTTAQAHQLLSVNQIEALLGCIPAGSPAPAAPAQAAILQGT
jgi:hypothetical protein